MARLTLAEQRRLVRALPAHRHRDVRLAARRCELRGDGLLSILKSIGKALGVIGKEVGPTILREIAVPLLKKKLAGKGLRLAGGKGGGLRLAGGK